jgi:hypothetical protein
MEEGAMFGKQGRWWAGWVLVLGLAAPGSVLAGPFFGDWSWGWRPAPDCQRRGDYSPMHYWTPGYYEVRSYAHPKNLDQFPPGPAAGIAPSYEFNKAGCQSISPAPSSPYADPTSYYGRPIAPPK